MPEAFEIPNELAALIDKKVVRIGRPKSGKIEPDATIKSVLFYSAAAGDAHAAGWHICLERYNQERVVIPLSEMGNTWELRL